MDELSELRWEDGAWVRFFRDSTKQVIGGYDNG